MIMFCSVRAAVKQFKLEETHAYRKFIERYEAKLASVVDGFSDTIGTTSEDWKGANRKNRQAVARLAAHGFHDKFCAKEKCYEPNETFNCNRCEMFCPRYHDVQCTQVSSLAELSKRY